MSITYPNTQALTSATFKAPHPLLASPQAILTDFYEYNAANSPQHPLFRFWDDVRGELVDLTWGLMGKAFWATARLLVEKVGAMPGERPVVAILATSGAFIVSTWTFVDAYMC